MAPTSGVGRTVMLNGIAVPGQVTPAEIYCGVTLIVAVTS